MAVPPGPAVMSIAPSPSIEMLPMAAIERSVMSGRTSLLISSQRSTALPSRITSVTLPTSIPETRTGVPARTVATLSKRAFSG